ncbi:hypothetical protein BJ878DRAFT_415048, partial [Calycina marina]
SVYTHSGRGGVGNTFKAPKTSADATARGPASLFGGAFPQTSSRFSSGHCGAGNIKPVSEKAIFSFDEELERQRSREKKLADGAIWHVGRGGAGNYASYSPPSYRKDSSSSNDSHRSSRFFSRISSTFERR